MFKKGDIVQFIESYDGIKKGTYGRIVELWPEYASVSMCPRAFNGHDCNNLCKNGWNVFNKSVLRKLSNEEKKAFYEGGKKPPFDQS